MAETPETRTQNLMTAVLPGVAITLCTGLVIGLRKALGDRLPGWSVWVATVVLLAELILMIVWGTKDGGGWWRTAHRRLLLAAGVVISGVVLLVAAMTQGPAVMLQLQFAYIDKNGTTRVLPPGTTPGFSYEHSLTDAEKKRRAIDVPIGVALANTGYRRLTKLQVRLTYPAYLRVKSDGTPGVSSDDRSITYDNAVPEVLARDSTLRTTEIDTLTIPFTPWGKPVAVVTRDGVPGLVDYTLATFIPPEGSDEEPSIERLLSVPIGLEVFDGDQSLGGFEVRVSTPPLFSDIKIDMPHGDMTRRATATDRRLVRDAFEHGVQVRRIDGSDMAYVELRRKGRFLQAVLVDDQVRRVFVDEHADNTVDWDAWDLTKDGRLDARGDFRRPEKVRRWKASWVDVTARETR